MRLPSSATVVRVAREPSMEGGVTLGVAGGVVSAGGGGGGGGDDVDPEPPLLDPPPWQCRWSCTSPHFAQFVLQ